MDNLININNTKTNTLEFEMTIEGANTSNVECNFVIVAKNMDFRFKATISDKKANLWNVKIPEMPFLERTTYNCYTEVVTDGQYFKPMSGNVNVVGSTQIYTSPPQNKTVESDIEKIKVAKKEDEKRETKRKNESWRQREKSVEQLANELLSKQKYESKVINEKVEENRKTSTTSSSDAKTAKIRAILEETGYKPKDKKTNRVSFVRTKILN